MTNAGFFMRDQVRDRVSDIMREPPLTARSRSVGGDALTALVVILTIANVLAVAPGA